MLLIFDFEELGKVPIWALVLFGAIFLVLFITLFFYAVISGREVSIYPPKIGPKIDKSVKKNNDGSIPNQAQIIGNSFLRQGLTKFHFTRDDYGRTLASFLDSAKTSIEIVSISLKITNEEGQFLNLFRKKLAQNPNFIIHISLINPNNLALVQVAADTLAVPKEKLRKEISEMLKDMLEFRNMLFDGDNSRFIINIHDCFPMGSAIMLDATPNGGMIQIETKLYKAPRSESFGFKITRESAFYKNNYTAWHRILKDSKSILLEDLKV